MNRMFRGMLGKFKKEGKRKLLFFAGADLVLIGAIVFMHISGAYSAEENNPGKGSQEALTIGSVVSNADGVLKKVYFKPGDAVKAGDLLMEVDTGDKFGEIEAAKAEIRNLEKKQKELAGRPAESDVRAPFSGKISRILAVKGSSLKEGDAVAAITDTSRLRLALSFSMQAGDAITPGEAVKVSLWDYTCYIDGVVSGVGEPVLNSAGGYLYRVEIEIQNPGAGGLKEGMNASGEIMTPHGPVTSVDSGRLYGISEVLRAQTSGVVKDITITEGQTVGIDDILLKLEDKEAAEAYAKGERRLEELKRFVDKGFGGIYKIYAPSAGRIINQEAAVGSAVTSGQTLCVIQ